MQHLFRSSGITESEQYLARLCEKTFLRMWSFANVYRDQGGPKELCDLLIVCGDHVIIFSDKSCTYPASGNEATDWCRWYRNAIQKSVKQLEGAERWLRAFPSHLFVDPRCTQRLPIDLPPVERLIIHRVIVSLGAKNRCREAIGGSGSLVLCPAIVGDQHTRPDHPSFAPFHIGTVSRKGVVHIFDDVTLNIVLQELDTVTDFIRYLEKKESFIASGKLAYAAGEENLLALYLTEMNANIEHDFPLPVGYAQLAAEDGAWHRLKNNPRYKLKQEANAIAYGWDALIEHFSKHILGGTLEEGSASTIAENELGLRLLARESRLDRRVLSHSLATFFRIAPRDKNAMRTVLSKQNQNTAYVFLLVPYGKLQDREYREYRKAYLTNYCFVLAYKHRDLATVIGIAMETEPTPSGRSEDLLVYQPLEWTPELERTARSIQQDMGILKDENLRMTHIHSDEYPDPPAQVTKVQLSKKARKRHMRSNRVGRNDPCPCGSGKKLKHCHGSPI